MAQLPVAPHLTPEEIDQRYRSCSDAAEKSRWHVLWLVTRPDDPMSAAARLVGFKLNPPQQAELFAALQKPPADGGLWSGPKVAAFVRDRFGITIVKQTGWPWLKELGFRLVAPRPRRPKAATRFQQQDWL